MTNFLSKNMLSMISEVIIILILYYKLRYFLNACQKSVDQNKYKQQIN